MRLMEEYAGQGVSKHRRDSTLLDPSMVDDVEFDPWASAMMELEDGDAAPLYNLLKSDRPLPPWFRHWVRYYLDKYQFKLRKGKARTVAPYAITSAELKISEMIEDVQYYLARNKGKSDEDARLIVAKRFAGRKPSRDAVERLVDKLEIAMRDGRGSTRRARERKGR
jgi:hypothetical protein